MTATHCRFCGIPTPKRFGSKEYACDACLIEAVKVFTAWQRGEFVAADLETAVKLQDAHEESERAAPKLAAILRRLT